MKNKFKIFLLVTIGFLLFAIMSCKKKTETSIPQDVDTVTDIDGNIYKTIQIGTQRWMIENLKTKTYNDNTPILEISSSENDSVWSSQTDGAFCQIDERYGLLYNWFAVNSNKKIAPKGWHIPSDEEWKTMEKYLGMSQSEVDKTSWRGTNEAEKLVPKSSVGWPTESVIFGTNESGFLALPGGCRLFNGKSNSSSNTGFWWTSSTSENNAIYRYLDSKKKNIFRHSTYKTYGFSVRCVKD